MLAAGLVVAVAPLMGSAPHIDKAHGRWLHVHVRPPVRGLLKVVKVSASSITPVHHWHVRSCVCSIRQMSTPHSGVHRLGILITTIAHKT